VISRLNPTFAYLIGLASVLTGLGLGLLWTPAERLLLNPYRFWSVSQVCDLRGEKTLLGGEFETTRYDEIVAGTVDIYSLCDTPFYSYPIPSLYPTAIFMLAILLSLLSFIALLVVWFRGKSQAQSLLVLPILLTLVSATGIWHQSAMNEPNSKSSALFAAGHYLSSYHFSEPQLREQLAGQYSSAEIEYALEHVKVDWSLQAYRRAEQFLSIYPERNYKSVLQSQLLDEGHELAFIQIALTVMQLEEKKN
jgi:hypothetical protein